MNNNVKKVIDVPSEVDEVTLKIVRDNAPEILTLRQVLMSVPSTRPVVVSVVESQSIVKKELRWRMVLPAIGTADEMGDRRARVSRFSECGLCDTAVLLDERGIKSIDIGDAVLDECVRGAVMIEVSAV